MRSYIFSHSPSLIFPLFLICKKLIHGIYYVLSRACQVHCSKDRVAGLKILESGSWEKLKAVPEEYWSRFLKNIGVGF